MSAGDIYYSAISNLGNQIANSIGEYQQRKRDQDMVAGQLEVFAQSGMINKKEYEVLNQYMARHRDVGAAVVGERLKFLQALALTGAKSRVKDQEFTRREILKTKLGEERDARKETAIAEREKAKNPMAKKAAEFTDVFVNPIKEELGTADANMKPESFKGTEEDKATHARVTDKYGTVRVMPIEVYRKGKKDAAASQQQPQQGTTFSSKAMAIKKLYQEGKLSKDAAKQALKDLDEGWKD